MEKQKDSVLGILALIFSILGCTFFIAIILAIIDLAKHDGKKKTLSIIALVISGVWLMIGIIGSATKSDSNNTSKTNQQEVEAEIETEIEPETPSDDVMPVEESKAPVVEKQVVEEPTIEEPEPIVEEPTIEEPIAEEPDSSLTLGQKNALASAHSYLNYSSFSHKGLVEQLVYEGYSEADATFAADNCDADWNEQAAKTAQSYLDYTSFSRDGLIEQLEYEGYTREQAEYGVSAVGY